MGELMNDCLAAAKSDARITWVSAEFLEAHGVVDGDLPIWSHAVGENAGFALTSAQRALAAGLKIRPLSDTVRATLAWQLVAPGGAAGEAQGRDFSRARAGIADGLAREPAKS